MNHIGLKNPDYLCFANAVIQCLYHTKMPDKCHHGIKSECVGHCSHVNRVVEEWCSLRKKMSSSDRSADLSEMKKEVDRDENFVSVPTTNIMESFKDFIDMLPCESDVFRGQYRNCINFTILSLPITGNDLNTLYSNYLASKKFTVHKFPQRLIISFNRFDSNMKKIDGDIHFPVDQLLLDGHKFKLYAIVTFTGEFLNVKGHFGATIRESNIWRSYRDEKITEREFDKEYLEKHVYMLWYEKF